MDDATQTKMDNLPTLDKKPQPIWLIFTTLFWAVTLVIIPGAVIGYAFSIYADANNIVDTVKWFGQIEVMMVMTFFIYFITLPMIIGLTKFSAQSQSIFVYLNIKPAHRGDIIKVVVMSTIFWGLLTLGGMILNLPEEPFMLELKQSSLPIWFISLTVCVMAPIIEEVACRGFLFKRFQQSILGISGAVVITSLLFTSLHTQYEIVGLSMVFIMALYFSWLRVNTNNTSLCIIGHAMCNGLTLIALYWFT